jgi:hypothetical protein
MKPVITPVGFALNAKQPHDHWSGATPPSAKDLMRITGERGGADFALAGYRFLKIGIVLTPVTSDQIS